MSLFGSSVKQSSAKADAESGIGEFAPINNISTGGMSLINFKSPVQLGLFAVLGLIGFIAYRKGYKWIG